MPEDYRIRRSSPKHYRFCNSHSAPGPISLSVREGRIAADEVIEAGTETVFTCDAGVRHSVEAVSDAVCFLNIAAGGIGRGGG